MMDSHRETAEDNSRDVPQRLVVSSPSAQTVAAATRRELTQEAFDKLLARLDEDRERAGEKYQELRGRLVRFFEWQTCPFPEDHADEAINRVAHKLVQGEEIRAPSSYSFGVARMLLLEIRKEQERERRALHELPATDTASHDDDFSEAGLECLRQCLESLLPDDRELLMHYYQGEKGEKIENRRSLAERLRVSLNTLRMRALRLREKLEACVVKCLKV